MTKQRYAHHDGRGNIIALTKDGAGMTASQAVVARYRYDAYGVILLMDGGVEAESNPYRWQSKRRHSGTSFYDFGFRFYSPHQGRFINRDPIGEAGGINLYGYVGNNPVNRVDAYGLKDYGADWVEGQKRLWQERDKWPWMAAWNHSGLPGGLYGHPKDYFDYKNGGQGLNEYSDRVCLNGRWVTPSAFGNYGAGYVGQYSAAFLGPAAAHIGGTADEASDYFTGQQHRDDGYTGWKDAPRDFNFIKEGARDAGRFQFDNFKQRLSNGVDRMERYLPLP